MLKFIKCGYSKNILKVDYVVFTIYL